MGIERTRVGVCAQKGQKSVCVGKKNDRKGWEWQKEGAGVGVAATLVA